MSRPPGIEIDPAWLKRRRMALRMTQAEMAAFLDISESHYRGIEAGTRRVSNAVYTRIFEIAL